MKNPRIFTMEFPMIFAGPRRLFLVNRSLACCGRGWIPGTGPPIILAARRWEMDENWSIYR